MKQNDNLDLNNYKPFMNEFQKYSSNLFDFGDTNIFKPKEKPNEEILKDRLKRSTKNEYELIQKHFRLKAAEDLSPERLEQMMKKYPPFEADAIPEDQIDTFQTKGEQGWCYLTQQILADNSAIEEKLEKMKVEHEQELKRREFKERRSTLGTKGQGKDANANQDLGTSVER